VQEKIAKFIYWILPEFNMKLDKSKKIYIILILILASCAALTTLLLPGYTMPAELPAPIPVLALANFLIMVFLYGGLGLLGLHLSKKLKFPEIWDRKVTNKQRFLIPLYIGIALAVFFIIIDVISSWLTGLRFPHPPFPTSVLASFSAGIGEEIIFRLFFVSFWVWLISYVILKKKFQNTVFWVVAAFSALAFALGHLPSVMYLLNYTSIAQIPAALWLEIIVLNGIMSLFAAAYFRKYGFLAAVGIHFWTDIVWHVVYGLL
jgi:membrane protease YdiL (CAAX protease family)